MPSKSFDVWSCCRKRVYVLYRNGIPECVYNSLGSFYNIIETQSLQDAINKATLEEYEYYYESMEVANDEI